MVLLAVAASVLALVGPNPSAASGATTPTSGPAYDGSYQSFTVAADGSLVGGRDGNLGGVLTSDPDADGSPYVPASSPPNMQDIVVGRGTDGAVWYRPMFDYSGIWQPWASAGGQVLYGPAVTLGYNVMEGPTIAAVGTDHALWITQYDTYFKTWRPWHSEGGYLTSAVDAVLYEQSSGGLAFDVCGRGQDKSLWCRTFTASGTSNWFTLGGELTSGPTEVQYRDLNSANNTLQRRMIVRGNDNRYWYRNTAIDNSLQWGPWTNWQPLGSLIGVSDPDSAGRDVWVVVRGADGNLWHAGWISSWTWVSAT